MIMAKGFFTFWYDGIPYECKSGQFILIRPGVPHSFDCSITDLSQPHIHFDMIYDQNSHIVPVSFKDMCEMSPEERRLISKDFFEGVQKTPFVEFSNREEAIELLFGVIEAFQSCRRLDAKAALIRLIERLICDNFPDCFSEDRVDKYDVTDQLKSFIDSEHGINISLDTLEKQFYYNKFYLERQFKKKHGISLMVYAKDKKMSFACKLLKTQTVSDVSEKLGFSSIYAFSRAFKNKYGMYPTEYKKRV